MKTRFVEFVDSHTGGEPTRVIVSGGPDLGSGSLADLRERFRRDHDRFRAAVVCEPRGSDLLVGALLCRPCDATCASGVIFFNNVGVIGMCGHGTMGLLVTLSRMGRIRTGEHAIETPVGVVRARLLDANRVEVENIPAYRHRKNVAVEVDGHGRITGDVAWGGNWFFLVDDAARDLRIENADRLTDFAWRIRRSLKGSGITGADGAEIDHIEISGPSPTGANSRNFVLCPGGAYDRSPCGTGTSAKAACLFEDGKLRPGEVWRQESLVGSVFEVSVRLRDGKIIPTLRGSAFVTAEGRLVLDSDDPIAGNGA